MSVPRAERLGTCARERTGVFVSKGFGSLLFPLSSLLLKRLPLVDNPTALRLQIVGTRHDWGRRLTVLTREVAPVEAARRHYREPGQALVWVRPQVFPMQVQNQRAR